MDFKDELDTYLFAAFPDAKKASGGREIAIRCRICGDSSTDLNARHLYINTGDESSPPVYHCFKCGESGVLTKDVLCSFIGNNGTGDDFLYKLDKKLKGVAIRSRYKPNKNKIYKLDVNCPIEDTPINRKKLEYINKRLDVNLTFEDLPKKKIILDLAALLRYNKIEKFTRSPYFIKYVSKYCIGFVSMDNGYVTLRNLNKRPPNKGVDFRYAIYNIFNSYDSNMRYYCIPTQVNLLSNEPIHVHIAEGSFDILGVYYYNHMNENQNIYIASNGKSYTNVIKHVLISYGLTPVVFDMYLDNDVDDYYVMPFCKSVISLGIPVYLHRNKYKKEKDFGVSKDNIKDECKKL